MIPKKSTPIKNEILIDIFAKGLLTKDEMRIVSYIIRWSWGFNGKHRRQDFTKELTKKQIADDIVMDKGHFNRNINKMILENKINDKEGCYQFNEHYKEWEKLTISQPETEKKVDEKSIKSCRIVNPKLTNSQFTVDEKSTSTSLKPISDKCLPNPKETNKETPKETIKKRGDIFLKALKDFKTMRNKIKKPLTKRAEDMLLTSLNQLSKDEQEQVAILNQSIFHCWQGVYALKNKPADDETQPRYIPKKEPVLTREQIERNKVKIKELGNILKGKLAMPEAAEGGKI